MRDIPKFDSISTTRTFNKDYKNLSPEIKRQTDKLLTEISHLIPDGGKLPPGRNCKTRKGNNKPPRWQVYVNHRGYRLTFHFDKKSLVLRRIATHKEIQKSD